MIIERFGYIGSRFNQKSKRNQVWGYFILQREFKYDYVVFSGSTKGIQFKFSRADYKLNTCKIRKIISGYNSILLEELFETCPTFVEDAEEYISFNVLSGVV